MAVAFCVLFACVNLLRIVLSHIFLCNMHFALFCVPGETKKKLQQKPGSLTTFLFASSQIITHTKSQIVKTINT